MGMPFFHPPPRKPKISGNRVTRHPCKTIPPLGRSHHALSAFVLEEKNARACYGMSQELKSLNVRVPWATIAAKKAARPSVPFPPLHFCFNARRKADWECHRKCRLSRMRACHTRSWGWIFFRAQLWEAKAAWEQFSQILHISYK